MRNAMSVYYRLKIRRSPELKIGYLKHPLKIRKKDGSDLATFNEVIVRRDYDMELPFVPKQIIDGGANIGLTSVFFANKYPDATIIAIEPDADNFKCMQHNVAFYSQIKPLNSAIWSNSAYLHVVDHGRGTDGYTVEVAPEAAPDKFMATSIDDIMKDNNWNRIDILKLDIEGSEKEIFSSGYESWLPKTKVLIVETHDRFVKGSSKAVFAAISKYDFSCTIKGFNMIFVNQDKELVK